MEMMIAEINSCEKILVYSTHFFQYSVSYIFIT